ncbi:MAG: hypothetical protein IT162_12880 [Bryobacterales bacterium]|nr:hypothetical protein [Bryobacterales bacterium]
MLHKVAAWALALAAAVAPQWPYRRRMELPAAVPAGAAIVVRLDAAILNHARPDLGDLRVMRIGSDGAATEVPYLLRATPPAAEVYFRAAGSGWYWLYVGAPGVAAPAYGPEVNKTFFDNAVAVDLSGSMEPNPGHRALPWTLRHPIVIYVVVILLTMLVAACTLRLLRRHPQR